MAYSDVLCAFCEGTVRVWVWGPGRLAGTSKIYCSTACSDAHEVADAIAPTTCVMPFCERPRRGGQGSTCADCAEWLAEKLPIQAPDGGDQ